MHPSLSGLSRLSLLASLLLITLAVPLPAQNKAVLLGRAETDGTGFYNVCPANGLMVYASGDRTGARIWYITTVSLKTGKPVNKLTFKNMQVSYPTFSKDGKTLVWLNTEGKIVIRDLASGKERSVRYRAPVENPSINQAESLTLSDDLRFAMLNDFQKSVEFVDLSSGKLNPGPRISTVTDPIFFSPDGKIAYLNPKYSSSHTIAYDVATKKELYKLRIAAYSHYSAISPDGTTLAVTEPQLPTPNSSVMTELLGHIVLWDLASNKEKKRLRVRVPDDRRRLRAVAFSPDAKVLAFNYDQLDPRVNLLVQCLDFVDAETGKTLASMRIPHTPELLQFTPDGKSLASNWRHGGVDLYQVPPLKEPAASNTPVEDLVAKDSEWVNETPSRMLTILERNGVTYKARYLSDYYDREVTGKIKNGKISWLAKDVHASKGGPGGDHEGTIHPDGTIDFTVTEKGGSKKYYTLKLRK